MELDPQDKLSIINQHMKNILFALYNADLSLEEANALDVKNQSQIDALNAQIVDLNKQKDVLTVEFNNVQAEINASAPTN